MATSRTFPFAVVATLLTTTAISVSSARELPSYVPICRRSDPQLNECVRRATSTLQPYIAKGIPELNIPSVEPLTIPMVKLEQGTAAVNYKIKLTNIKIYGLGGYKFQSANFDVRSLKLGGTVDLPDLYLESDYVIDGRALLVPIKGNGIFNANLTDTKASVEAQGTVVKRKGVEYFKVVDTKVHLSVGGAKVHFGNLFNGDRLLSTTTNRFLNENAKDIIEEVKPAVEAVAVMILDDIANNFMRSAPYSKLLPP